MTGMFELFTDSDSSYRFRLTAPDGTVMALSRSFPDKPAAVAGIAAVREYAGMGHVTEIKPSPNDELPGPLTAPAPRGSGAATKPRSKEARGESIRLPHSRIPNAARFLGGRAIARNHQMIAGRQTLGPRTTQIAPTQ
jgi:uncharacterized protein